jgi:hypothetical protein
VSATIEMNRRANALMGPNLGVENLRKKGPSSATDWGRNFVVVRNRENYPPDAGLGSIALPP